MSEEERYIQLLRQAEFLNHLSLLMHKYDASFDIEECDHQRQRVVINACGTWVPYHDIYHDLQVDDVICATQATIDHAKSITLSEPEKCDE